MYFNFKSYSIKEWLFFCYLRSIMAEFCKKCSIILGLKESPRPVFCEHCGEYVENPFQRINDIFKFVFDAIVLVFVVLLVVGIAWRFFRPMLS